MHKTVKKKQKKKKKKNYFPLFGLNNGKGTSLGDARP